MSQGFCFNCSVSPAWGSWEDFDSSCWEGRSYASFFFRKSVDGSEIWRSPARYEKASQRMREVTLPETNSKSIWRLAGPRKKRLSSNHQFSRGFIKLLVVKVRKWVITPIYVPGSRFATTPPPPTWYGPKTCVLQHSAWKRCICSVFCMVGCWRGPQTCKFLGFLQPTFRKRVICNVLASTSWSSAAAPSSISMSTCHIIL